MLAPESSEVSETHEHAEKEEQPHPPGDNGAVDKAVNEAVVRSVDFDNVDDWLGFLDHGGDGCSADAGDAAQGHRLLFGGRGGRGGGDGCSDRCSLDA